MSLSVGIVGLPNVGKSTLFNALLKKQQAYVANFPFATIEPNIGVIPVPDDRLKELAEVVAKSHSEPGSESSDIDSGSESGMTTKRPPEVPATVQFVDIAGLIAGASKGEGLGNKFLSHIRETNAICHVIRAFSDPDVVKEGTVNPKSDLEIIETELVLADLQTIESQNSKIKTQNQNLNFKSTVEKIGNSLSRGIPARDVELSEEERKEAKQLSLLTAKPILVVLNIDEADLKNAWDIENKFAGEVGLEDNQVVAICAKTEMQLADLDPADQIDYLKDLGIENSGLERLIQKAFSTLNLIVFLTAGEKEVRAWTVKKGSTAIVASGEIHTDFIKNFIKADIVAYESFVDLGGWKACRDQGKVRSEGRDYIIQDGDVVEFKIGH